MIIRIPYKLFSILTLVFCVSILTAKAQERFYLKAPAQANTGQQIKVSYILENANGSNFQYPRTFDGFQVLSGPNQSSNFQWVNGKTTQSIEYYFILIPAQQGEFVIPAASIQVAGKTLQTETHKISVKQGAQQNNQQNQAQRSGQSQQQSQPSADWREEAKENIFVRLYADKTNPFEGEQLTLYAKLYQRVQSFNTQVVQGPEFNGFWKHDYDMSKSEWQQEEYNGKMYNTLLVAKYALFPQREGSFTISPFKLKTILRIQDNAAASQNPWDWFFRMPQYRDVEYEFSSGSLNINVKPLPSAGKPASFNGAVGNFNFEWQFDSTSLEVGSAATLKTKLSGTGNIMLAAKPSINFPSGLEVYDPQVSESISKNVQPIGGTIKSDYLIIPEIPGEYEIAPVEFSYFDLKSQTYKTISPEPIRFVVKGDIPQKIVSSEEKQMLEEEEKDIRFIHLSNDLQTEIKPIITSIGYWSAVGAAPLFFLLLLLLRKKVEEKSADIVGIKSAKAAKLAHKRLEKSAAFLQSGHKTAFYYEVVKAVWKYLADKLNIDQAKLSREFAAEKLMEKKVSKDTIDSLFGLIDKCEMALYSPAEATEMSADFEKAKTLIIALENEVK